MDWRPFYFMRSAPDDSGDQHRKCQAHTQAGYYENFQIIPLAHFTSPSPWRTPIGYLTCHAGKSRVQSVTPNLSMQCALPHSSQPYTAKISEPNRYRQPCACFGLMRNNRFNQLMAYHPGGWRAGRAVRSLGGFQSGYSFRSEKAGVLSAHAVRSPHPPASMAGIGRRGLAKQSSCGL